MLNPELYGLLAARFGSVLVAKEGEQLLWRINKLPDGKTRLDIIDFGETYRVCCPYCAQRGDPDKRYRLWVSHAWGTYVGNDFVGKVPVWHTVTCFHNDCLGTYDAKMDFRNMVLGPSHDPRPPILYDGVNVEQPAGKTYPTLPGECRPICEFSQDHPAVQFLAKRGIDHKEAYDRHNLHVCLQCDEFPYIAGGIIIPVIIDGRQVGWQCRMLHSDRKFRYFTPPGMQLARFVYNFDRCLELDRDYIVVVEGPFDAIRLENAVALFGKNISIHQQYLVSRWRRCVVFLDPDAEKEANAVVAKLRNIGLAAASVRGHEADPAKLDRSRADELIRQALVGIDSDERRIV